jgi:hypothetical protein
MLFSQLRRSSPHSRHSQPGAKPTERKADRSRCRQSRNPDPFLSNSSGLCAAGRRTAKSGASLARSIIQRRQRGMPPQSGRANSTLRGHVRRRMRVWKLSHVSGKWSPACQLFRQRRQWRLQYGAKGISALVAFFLANGGWCRKSPASGFAVPDPDEAEAGGTGVSGSF